MRNLLLTCCITFIAYCSFEKTYLHCFTINGKITDSSGKARTNEMLIFNPGKWNEDTIYTDQNGYYTYTVAYWPPCHRKAGNKFWRSSQEIFVSGKESLATILYKPKDWLLPCEGKRTKQKTMTKNFVL